MKYISYYLAICSSLIITSCDTAMQIVNHGIEYWTTTVPADTYDHTLIDAWQNGTGGKILSIGHVGTTIIGEITGKDVSGIKGALYNAMTNTNSNETFSNGNDLNNLIGAALLTGDELIKEYNNQKFEDLVSKLTDPSNPNYNEEEALRVEDIDYENHRIIWKPYYNWIKEVTELRAEKRRQFIEENLDITYEEYENLPERQRQEMDLKLIKRGIENPTADIPIIPEEPDDVHNIVTNPESTNFTITEVVIDKYNFNSVKLSAEKIIALDSILEYMNDHSEVFITITGHTCSLGSEDNNYNIGLKRAAEAKKYLTEKGISSDRISIKSAGFHEPVTTNETPEGRKSNRRITFQTK